MKIYLLLITLFVIPARADYDPSLIPLMKEFSGCFRASGGTSSSGKGRIRFYFKEEGPTNAKLQKTNQPISTMSFSWGGMYLLIEDVEVTEKGFKAYFSKQDVIIKNFKTFREPRETFVEFQRLRKNRYRLQYEMWHEYVDPWHVHEETVTLSRRRCRK